MKVTYLYNSGFILEFQETVVIIDYYAATQEDDNIFAAAVNKALTSGKKPYVLVTHGHSDHFDAGIYSWNRINKNITYVVSFDVPQVGAPLYGLHVLSPGGVFNDGIVAVRAFGSTDQGSSFLIGTLGKIVFHAGDLNNWHWNEECPPEEAKGYEEAYLKELELLAGQVSKLDLAMLPLDPRLGADYARGAKQFLERISVDVLLPMHFRDEYVAANAFMNEASTYGTRFMELSDKCQTVEI